MFWRKKKLGQPVASYQVETAPVQLKIIRTHIAAQAGELSNIGVHLGHLNAKVDQLIRMVTDVKAEQ